MTEEELRVRQGEISTTSSNTLNLDRIVFLGRTLPEYMRMFSLDPSELKGLKILDCPSGASSIITEASRNSNAKSVTEVIFCTIMM